MCELRKGDFIECRDPEDLAQTMMDLAKEDVETDFVYKRNGEDGYWLEVIKVEKKQNNHQ